MKCRMFLSLCWSGLLMLPMVAQQTNGGSDQAGGSQTVSASQSASERDPLTVPKSRDFWDGDDPNVVNLVMHPWANKRYVRRLTQPIHDRLNELEQINAEQKSAAKDIDTRAQHGLQLASEKTSLADQHATDAASRAQAAQTAATQSSTKVSSAEQMVNGLDQYKGNAQTEIRFRPGQTALSKTAKDALDQMAGPLRAQSNYIVEVRGFAPGSGTAAITSSQKMADSVVRYLVFSHNIPMYRIYVLSLGNAQSGDGSQAKRVSAPRVEVNVQKNNVMSTAQR